VAPDTPIQYLPGVGPKRAERFEKLGIARVEDLLRHVPREYLDARNVVRVKDLVPGKLATVIGKVTAARERRRPGRSDFLASVGDATGTVQVTWFGQGYLSRVIRPGDEIALSGVPELTAVRSFANPTFEVLDSEEKELLHAGRIIPVHPLTAGLSAKVMRTLVHTALEQAGDLIEDPLPGELRAERDLESLPRALRDIHFPADDLSLSRARRRLAYEELFFVQALLALRRARRESQASGFVTAVGSERARAFVRGLPFKLTAAQKRIVGEILADQRTTRPMQRLLVGDVGSGKTVVALIACLHAIEAGYQAAIMAPTEILAEQHFQTIARLSADFPLRTVLVTGRGPAAARKKALAAVASGEAELVVGTHALIQGGVAFARLGLVVVDEQHRFGVRQRASLASKGETPDVLVMSATPIPRSLALACFGDLDISTLDEKPAGRGKVRTRVTDESKRERVYEFLASELTAGRQVYVVLPLIEESEKADLRAATATHDAMSKHPLLRRWKWGLLHGRLKAEERQRVMADFVAGKVRGLVSTTVIEVGVDVSNATVMLIEQAERFGLAQLHQLRGRVGRGEHVSTCVLMAGGSIRPEAQERLRVVASTQNGFRLAEEDLRLRGPGELWGTMQTGLPRFKVADLATDAVLLGEAQADARALLGADPELERAEHGPLRRALSARFHEEVSWSPTG
jgi:ATP-dependent DNA helicase RecG